MTQLAISGWQPFPDYTYPGNTATLRIFYSQTFIASDGQQVIGDPTRTGGFYLPVPCTVVNGVLNIPTFSLTTTDDTLTQNNPLATAVIYDQDQTPREEVFSGFTIPNRLAPSTDIGTLTTANQTIALTNPVRQYLDRDQTISLIREMQSPKGSNVVIGGWRSKIAPISALDPVLCADNDTRVEFVTPEQYGAVGDGTGATITSADVLAHAAGTDYPWIGIYTVGVDTKDYVGIQECFYKAFAPTSVVGSNTPTWGGSAGSARSQSVHLQGRDYRVNKSLIIKKTVGGLIIGAGDIVTTIRGSAALPVVSTNNLSYSMWIGIQFAGLAAHGNAVFEMDRDANDNTPPSASNQKNTFLHCLFHGSGAVGYGMRIANSGSNSQGSENAFYSCTFTSCTTAGVGLNDFNALNNNFYNCDFLGCSNYGIYIGRGTVNMFGGAFEGGFYPPNVGDVYIATSANDGCVFHGVRTESAVFLALGADKKVVIDGLDQNAAANLWTANTVMGLGQLIYGTPTNGDGKIYRATVAGTTAGTEPVWANGVVDGTVTWTLFDYDTITGSNICLRNSLIQGGRVNIGTSATTHCNVFEGNEFTRADWMKGEWAALANSFLCIQHNIVKVFGNGGQIRAYKVGTNGNGTPYYAAKNMLNVGGITAILFSAGAAGSPAYDVGFIRGGASSGPALATNSVQMIGGLTLQSYTFAQVTGATPPNGTQVYVTDGTAGSNPLTGGGGGTSAKYDAGAWKAF